MSAWTRFSLTFPLVRILLTLGLLLAAITGQAIERVTYYHNDALGSPVAVTDRNGTLLWRESYAPYGERLTREASSKDTVWYTGKQEEAAFGLNYFGARWYDPRIGRFMGVDPAGFSSDNIQSFNRYAYANNNPYAYVDPDGEEALYGVSLDIAAMQGRNVEAIRAGNKEFGKFLLGATAVAIVSIYTANVLGPTAAEVLLAGATGEAALGVGTKGSLGSRVESVHGALDPIAQTRRTTAGLDTAEGTRVFAAGGRDLSPAQRSALAQGETAARLPGAHAEVTALEHAAASGLTPTHMQASRSICSACAARIEQSGGRLTSPTTAVWP